MAISPLLRGRKLSNQMGSLHTVGLSSLLRTLDEVLCVVCPLQHLRLVRIMLYVACDNCGSDETAPVLAGRDLLHGLPGEFTLVRCKVCGLIYQNPQLTREEADAYYPTDYEAHIGTRKERLSWLRRIDYRYGVEKRHRAILRHASVGRMLDVGCATGAFLDGAREHGWIVQGIEPNVNAANYAREQLGLSVQIASLETAELTPDSFDVVTMWNVLEHVPSPSQALARVGEALRPGGLLVFAVPSTQSVDLRVFRGYWAGYDVPRHLFVFPPAPLENMVRSSGFQLVCRRCIYGTYHAFVFSARFAMSDRMRNDTIRLIIARTMLSLPCRALMIPPSRVIDALNLGSIMTWFCRKVE